jgi:DNA polymerase I-like protein with 3'-5' exonuclease and polymerase domains
MWSEVAECKVLPTFHPADVLRAWTHRPIVVQDFRRARREAAYREVITPVWEFTVEPTLDDIRDWLATYASDPDTPLVSDTEGWGRVDCIGFAADSRAAICIPFARQVGDNPHYWPSAEAEFEAGTLVTDTLRRHRTTFHNATWDCQVIAQSLGILPLLSDDTQVAQHVAFPGLLGGKIDPTTGRVDKKGSSLSLSFVASMYCEHYRFWKDDGRTFDPAIHDERQYWSYNCEDCVRTAEAKEALLGPGGVIDNFGLRDQYLFTMSLFGPVLNMMFRGFRYDAAEARRQRDWFGRVVRKAGVVTERREGAITAVQDWLNAAVGCDFNPDSGPQMRALFYDDLGVRKRFNRHTKALTLDDAALDGIKREQPLLYPLVTQIQNYRTLDTLRASLEMRVSDDGRLRCAINPAFVETFRFSTNETAFGEGSNLQNIKRPDND